MSAHSLRRILILLVLAAPSAVRAAPMDCFKYRSPMLSKTVQYCVQRTRPDRSPEGEPVFYFMHGIFGDAKRWQKNRYDESVRKLASQEGFAAASFVSFDTSALSYFIDQAGSPRMAFQTWFLEEFIPYIESTRRVCAVRECRGVIGNSMGGLGALHTALRFPEVFGLVAVNSPALLPFNIFEPWADWKSYIDRHPISRLKGRFLLQDSRKAFGTRENFDLHDPAWIVTHQWDSGRVFPALFMDVGGKDSWGFWEGFFRMRSALESRGIEFEGRFEPDGFHEIEAQPERRERLLRFVRAFIARRTVIGGSGPSE